jgi:hypothetical protein
MRERFLLKWSDDPCSPSMTFIAALGRGFRKESLCRRPMSAFAAGRNAGGAELRDGFSVLAPAEGLASE